MAGPLVIRLLGAIGAAARPSATPGGSIETVASTSDLQARIVETRASRGFTSDPVHLVVLLAEEVGEIAREVKKTWSANYDGFDADRLAPELADAFVLITALASGAGIDLETAVESKFFGDDATRQWRSEGQ